MKLILKREVDNLGLPGDVVEVADGYGRNYLIPRGKAILATRGAMKEAEAFTRARKAREAATLDGAKAVKDILEARTLRIAARVDDTGSLYGSVGAADVQRVLKERGHEIERKRIDLKGTIKHVGSYEIPVQVHPQVIATVTVDVVDEEGRVADQGDDAVDADAVVDEAAVEADAEVLAEQALEAARVLEEGEESDAEVQALADEDQAAQDDGEEPEQG